jgi:hypothetical protein
VRHLKDSLKGVQKELKTVNKRQKRFEEHHKQLKDRVESLLPLIASSGVPSSSSSSASSSSDGSSPTSGSPTSSPPPDPAAHALYQKLNGANPNIPAIPFPLPRTMPRTRTEILEYFPLLKNYGGLYSPDAPFVIDDFR